MYSILFKILVLLETSIFFKKTALTLRPRKLHFCFEAEFVLSLEEYETIRIGMSVDVVVGSMIVKETALTNCKSVHTRNTTCEAESSLYNVRHRFAVELVTICLQGRFVNRRRLGFVDRSVCCPQKLHLVENSRGKKVISSPTVC